MIRATDCVLILGRRGCGKSYLAKKIQNLWPRRVVIDVLDEYETTGDNVFAVYSFESFCDRLEFFREKRLKKFTLIYKFSPETDDFTEEFNHVLRLCWYFGNLQVVIEEIQEFSSPNFLPKWLKNCLLTGRHRNLSVLATSQRPGQVNKTIFSQCSHIFCGALIDGNDLKYCANFLNQSAEKLVTLPDRKFIYFSRDGVAEISNDL